MAFGEPLKFPLEVACPACRIIVTLNEGDIPVNDIATCPACKTPLVTIEEAHRQILESHGK